MNIHEKLFIVPSFVKISQEIIEKVPASGALDPPYETEVLQHLTLHIIRLIFKCYTTWWLNFIVIEFTSTIQQWMRAKDR